MQARYVDGIDLEQILDADSSVWRPAEHVALDLIGTPIGLQPAPAVRPAALVPGRRPPGNG